MAYTYGDAKTYLTATRYDLVEAAEKGMGGRGALVEATFRLIDTLETHEKETRRLNQRLFWLTVVIAVGTVALCALTGTQIYYQFHQSLPL